MPLASARMGNFQRWASVVGGALHVAGVPGFMENRTRVEEHTDDETGQWEMFLAAMFNHYPDKTGFTTKALARTLNNDDYLARQGADPSPILDTLPEYFSPMLGKPGLSRSLGKAFMSREDRWFAKHCLRAGKTSHHAKEWRVIRKLDGHTPPPTPPSNSPDTDTGSSADGTKAKGGKNKHTTYKVKGGTAPGGEFRAEGEFASGPTDGNSPAQDGPIPSGGGEFGEYGEFKLDTLHVEKNNTYTHAHDHAYGAAGDKHTPNSLTPLLDDPRTIAGASYVADPAALAAAIGTLSAASLVALDTETTGLDPHIDKLRILTLSDGANTFVIDTWAIPGWQDIVRPLLHAGSRTVLAHNAGSRTEEGGRPRTAASRPLASS